MDELDWLSGANRATARSLPAVNYTYQCDRFGNRWKRTFTSGPDPSMSLTFDRNNHLSGNARYGHPLYDPADILRTITLHSFKCSVLSEAGGALWLWYQMSTLVNS